MTNVSLAITKVSDADLAVTSRSSSRSRGSSLVGTPVTDAGLEHLKGLISPRRISTWSTPR